MSRRGVSTGVQALFHGRRNVAMPRPNASMTNFTCSAILTCSPCFRRYYTKSAASPATGQPWPVHRAPSHSSYQSHPSLYPPRLRLAKRRKRCQALHKAFLRRSRRRPSPARRSTSLPPKGAWRGSHGRNSSGSPPSVRFRPQPPIPAEAGQAERSRLSTRGRRCDAAQSRGGRHPPHPRR